MLGILLVVVIALVLLFPRSRARLGQSLKTLSDYLVVNALRGTSRFGSELTEEGRAEQKLWRDQRLRNLRGLALRSKQTSEGKTKQPKD